MIPFLLLTLGLGTAAAAEPFTFAALGDMPYGDPAIVNPPFEALIGAINQHQPAFTLHVGDTKSSSTPCTDALLDQQRSYMNSFDAALIYTPGDNEWTDCHRRAAGSFDPLERLAYLRRTYFADPSRSLGKAPIALESQAVVMAGRFAPFVENARFSRDGVHFITLHVVGSNNNFEPRDPAAVAEFFARDEANVAWLTAGFDTAIAERAPAVVVAFQADMFEFDFNAFGDESFLRHSGFRNVGSTLVEKAAEFGRPVLIVFGDSHIFRVFRPFPRSAPNVMALEVFGDKDMHAVEVGVDPADPAVFSFKPILNPRPLPPT